eukprot:1141877-Prymnesium_polylepis.1
MVIRTAAGIPTLRLSALLDVLLSEDMTAESVWAQNGALTCAPGDLLAARREPAHAHGRWAAVDRSTGQRVQADTLGQLIAAA